MKSNTAQVIALRNDLVAGLKWAMANRKLPSVRANVSEIILRIRQLNGIIEARVGR